MQNVLDLVACSFNGCRTGDIATIDSQPGVEIEKTNNRLSSICVTMAEFHGQLASDGKPLTLDDLATPADVIRLFGEPYWQDEDDDETILFYEYETGGVELQFEFANPQSLDFITIARPGVLADSEQRSAYGVNKTWPPAD